jgi:hypothetical protein
MRGLRLMVAWSLALPALGCVGNRMVVGLANAPSIQRVQPVEPTGQGVHDAVSNGGDACGTDGRSPLAGHWPPCSGEGVPVVTPRPRNDVLPPSSGEVWTTWVQHYYSNDCAKASPLTGNALGLPAPAAAPCPF